MYRLRGPSLLFSATIELPLRAGAADVGAALGDAGFLEADPGEGCNAVADDFLRRERETEAQMGFACRRVARPFGSRVEGDSGFSGGPDQLGHVNPVGQLEP